MTLAPGLYKATVRGVPDQVVLVGEDAAGFTAEQCGGYFMHYQKHITDARPLILLDLGDKHLRAVVQSLRTASNADHLHSASALDLMDIADQIEAQTKPARIEEPGPWGVVRASSSQWAQRYEYVRVRTDGNGDWQFGGGSVNWLDLIDPTLIRDGI